MAKKVFLSGKFRQTMTSQNTQTMNKFGCRIRELLDQQNLLQRQVAHKLDIAPYVP